MNAIIVMGSARSNGDTRKLVDQMLEFTDFGFLDLNTLDLRRFDYQHHNQDDDFLPTMKNILAHYDLVIFATPIYWYCMSSIMKVFFDRITDCITIEKDIGRRLRGKMMASMSCSNSDDVPSYFHHPFEASAEYLGMKYLGHCHGWVTEGQINPKIEEVIKDFSRKLCLN